MNKTSIRVHGQDYYSIPKAAKELEIAASTLRTIISGNYKNWLDERNIEIKPEDILQSPTNRKIISSSLVEKLKPLMWGCL